MIWIVVAIAVVLVLAVLGAMALGTRRSKRLREGFGPEYDRTVERHGDPRAAEADLQERRNRRRGLDIRPLEPEARDAYAERWTQAQRRFVDAPADAVAEADELVAEVMKRLAEGFATERERLEGQWSRGEDVSTEDLRVALQRYRSFFQRLLST